MLRIILFFAFTVTFLVSCNKESQITGTEEKSPYKDEFVTCNCSQLPDKEGFTEYIKAEINGVSICADIKRSPGDTFPNMLMHGFIKRATGDNYYDNLIMIRYTNDSKFMMGIFLENTHALTKQFPYLLPRYNPELCEIGELQLQNEAHITSNMCNFCPTNDWHYYNQFQSSGLTLYADKYANGIFEGRFDGTIRTGSGRTAIVKNGTFRIRLIEFRRDIKQ